MRRLVATGALALAVTLSISASADPTPSALPRKGCSDFTDPAGDASFTGVDPSASELDITGVSYRLTDSVFSTVVRVPGLKALAVGRGTGDKWISRFKVGKHTVEIWASRLSPAPLVDQNWEGGLSEFIQAPIENLASVRIDGADKHALRPGTEFDVTHGYVVMSVDRPGLEEAVGAPLATLGAAEVEADTRVVIANPNDSLDSVGDSLIFPLGVLPTDGLTAFDLATAPAKQVVDATANTCFV
jgi:hypothetical protein